MKRAKIISAISLLMLCICMLTIGVLAVDAPPEVGMGGSITVPANDYIISVKGYIGENIDTNNLPAPDFCSVGEAPEENPNGTVYGSEWVFTPAQLQKMSFNLSGVNTLDDLKKKSIYITFQIETTSNFDMKAYFTKETEVDVWEESDSDVLGEEAINVVLNKASISASGTSNTQTTYVSIRFSPLKFAESEAGDAYSFKYTLNVEEDIPDTVETCDVSVKVNNNYVGGSNYALAYIINDQEPVLFESLDFLIKCKKGDIIKFTIIEGNFSGDCIVAVQCMDLTADIVVDGLMHDNLYANSGNIGTDVTVNKNTTIEVDISIIPQDAM